MESYRELKQRHQQEFNALPIFFAFDEQQYQEGLKKVNATSETPIVKLAGGCYVKQSDFSTIKRLLEQHKEEHSQNMMNSDTYTYNMLRVELVEREYASNRDLKQILNACIPSGAKDNIPNLNNTINRAVQDYLKTFE
ncbi:DUF7659 family protein [Staphylococcus capitis]|uniref:Phage protein n=3 Tax=Staphylococcus capitis TaxID=29388 RepID=A0ABX1SQR3_STACP|nr:hypothetical protein [Staphylococcus capitis]NMK54645.1 hypothetical protein [Staphylococcus capitis]NMK69928.1 hypothetical protein [Staphylococcus capitis]NMK82933.1 hypothetical protein [Staphylococcus capitis]